MGRVVGFLAITGSTGKVLLPSDLSLPNLGFLLPGWKPGLQGRHRNSAGAAWSKAAYHSKHSFA